MTFDPQWKALRRAVAELPVLGMAAALAEISSHLDTLSMAYVCDDCFLIYSWSGIQMAQFKATEVSEAEIRLRTEYVCWECMAARKQSALQSELGRLFEGMKVQVVPDETAKDPDGGHPGQYL